MTTETTVMATETSVIATETTVMATETTVMATETTVMATETTVMASETTGYYVVVETWERGGESRGERSVKLNTRLISRPSVLCSLCI
jgi:hypothetical protein